MFSSMVFPQAEELKASICYGADAADEYWGELKHKYEVDHKIATLKMAHAPSMECGEERPQQELEDWTSFSHSPPRSDATESDLVVHKDYA